MNKRSAALLADCIEELRRQVRPVSAARLRSVSAALGDVHESALERLLIEECRHGRSGVRLHLEGDLAEFSYAPETPVTPPPADGEARLYAPFAGYLIRNGAKAFVLDHRRARRRRGDFNQWNYPDVAAINCGEVIAFEIKRELVRRNLRWALSECQWNGAWANKRYVVAPAEKTDRALIEALPRLRPPDSVGVILLHCDMLDKRAPIIRRAEVLHRCPNGDFDRAAFLELAGRWPELEPMETWLQRHIL